MSDRGQPGKPSDVVRLYTDMPVFELGSTHPAAGGPGQTSEEIGWDRNTAFSAFTSIQANPSEVEIRSKETLISLGWTVTDSTTADGPATISGTRTLSRAAQLKPADESARRLLGYWSLKDTYPPGIARGGCIMVNFDYRLSVTIWPAGKFTDAELSTVATPDAVGGCRIDISCNEVISPFRGRFPDPRHFSIGSELDLIDPTPSLKESLGEQ